MKRILTAVAIAAATLTGLTACDPPLPPEVRTAILEREVHCEPGEVSLSSSWLLEPVIMFASDTLSVNCDSLVVNAASEEPDANVWITANPSQDATYISTPFVYDASVLVTNFMDLTSLNFSVETIRGIFSGAITDWSDAAIAADNPNQDVPAGPISIVREARPEVIKAFESWMSYLLGEDFKTDFTPNDAFDYYQIVDGEEGSLGLISFQDNFDAYMLSASISTPKSETGVLADSRSIASATTQLDIVETANGISSEINFDAEPTPPAGTNDIVPPYQAIFPLYVQIASDADIAVQSVALYLMRQDTQSEIEQFSVVMLPEEIRLRSGGLVSKDIPQPELTDELLQELGLG